MAEIRMEKNISHEWQRAIEGRARAVRVGRNKCCGIAGGNEAKIVNDPLLQSSRSQSKGGVFKRFYHLSFAKVA